MANLELTLLYSLQKNLSRSWTAPSYEYREKNLLVAKEKHAYADFDEFKAVKTS
jgi:hypothetical protein